MTPTHRDGMAAARKVQAQVEAGELADPTDACTMLVYHLSLELRRTPLDGRMERALEAAQTIIDNTRESLE